MTRRRIVAGDIGGSHITIALFEEDTTGLQLLGIERENIDSFADKATILDHWASLIKKSLTPKDPVVVSLAIPAPFDYMEGICLIKEQGKYRSLYGVNVKKELSQRLGIPETSIRFINDAHAFLMGESSYGIGVGSDSILGITLGSGLGSALKSGSVVKDAELWSVPFKDDIAENYLGTPWFVKWAKDEFELAIEGVKEFISHPILKGRIDEVFDIYSSHLAEFIQNQYAVFQMDKVIIGGNISLSSGLFLNKTIRDLHQRGVDIPIEVSRLGEKSALYGAASLILEPTPNTYSNS
ncbi:ROK family protein [Shivajiella indica]|uniref:ROK family protein n=1 Tax=Shivajiella indica TaxID=872115 RepID=A0ABW5BAJ8_9BACT